MQERALSIEDIITRIIPAEPWAQGDALPWSDPGFSARVLQEHLDQSHGLGTRKREDVEANMRWVDEVLLGSTPAHVIDLACGPGEELHALARLGHRGKGVDLSPSSVAYGRARAQREGASLEFVEGDVRHYPWDKESADVVMCLYGQINVFQPEEAEALVARARQALEERGGDLVIEYQYADVIGGEEVMEWESAMTSPFLDTPHLQLYEQFWDELGACATERWHIIESQTGRVHRYAQTITAYEEEELISLCQRAGFRYIYKVSPFVSGAMQGAMGVLIASLKK